MVKPVAEIRTGAERDIEPLVELATRHGQEEAFMRRAFAASLGRDDRLLVVAFADSEAVAYGRAAYFQPPPDADSDAAPAGYYLGGLLVAEDWRHRGIGVALTQARMTWAFARAPELWYFTNARNHASRALHMKLGFVELDRDFWYPEVSFDGGRGVLGRCAASDVVTGDASHSRAVEIVDRIRTECAWVARQAEHVRINTDEIASYADALNAADPARPERAYGLGAEAEERAAAYWLTLDAVNFGSGWFPTLKKLEGMTGYRTIKAGIDRRFRDDGPWTAKQLRGITKAEIATLMGQEDHHPLMQLFKDSLRDLGAHIDEEYQGRFSGPIDAAGRPGVQPSVEGHRDIVKLVAILAEWDCFSDSSLYKGRTVPFLKRAQIAAADLSRAHVIITGVERLTMFADNLVPHVLRLDGILSFTPQLVARIENEELIEHGSPEEVEIRACAVHAVELIATATNPRRSPAHLDELLWNRGQEPKYKVVPRHRSRSTAY